jgi:hypothetical protein
VVGGQGRVSELLTVEEPLLEVLLEQQQIHGNALIHKLPVLPEAVPGWTSAALSQGHP